MVQVHPQSGLGFPRFCPVCLLQRGCNFHFPCSVCTLPFKFWPFQNFISDEYIATDMFRPWGRNGEDVECYGLDLDAFYVNTGFRTAILDVFRGPQRLHLKSVCRFAEPSEFIKRKKSKRWLGLFGRKQAGTEDSDNEGGDSHAPTPGDEHDYRLAVTNPKGNWLWQLATELVPMNNDHTDVLNDELPPSFNRARNPKCHPDVPVSDGSRMWMPCLDVVWV
jgi:hypothetical protein